MRFVLATTTGERELAVAGDGELTTVGDLLRMLGEAVPDAVGVDGRRVPTDHSLLEAGLVDGATLSVPAPPGAPVVADGAAEVAHVTVVAGAGTGDRVPLRGPVVVGRDAACDLVLPSDTVSAQHCRIVPAPDGAVVHDLGTTNGTWAGGAQASASGTRVGLGGLVRVGAVVLRVEAAPADDRPSELDRARRTGGARTVPFNRPPRPGAPPAVEPVQPPAPPPAERQPPQFQVLALLAPIVLGAVMVVVLDSWRYAAFMALSPVLLLATTVQGRRTARRDARRADRDHTVRLGQFEQAVAAAAAMERARRWEVLPPVPEVLRRATSPSTRLWERRLDHGDALRLHVGTGPVPWTPPLVPVTGHHDTPSPAAAEVLTRWASLPRTPVDVDLEDGGVVGIVGERAAAVALARSLLLQACVHHGPADLAAAVVTGHAGDWHWATWLPHVVEADRDGRRRLATRGGDAQDLLRRLRDGAGAGPDGQRVTLLVLDAPSLLRGRDADARAVLRGEGGPVAGIVLADTADQLPAVCSTVIEAGPDHEGRLVRPATREVVEPVLLAGVDVARCRRAARRLAGLEDPEVALAGARLPATVQLLSLQPEAATAHGVRAAWRQHAGTPVLGAPIGVGEEGPWVLDLVADGPHGLLGGTTGSGKSELLRTVVAALAATHDPDHCTFVLVDYKGGAAFDACADLPHVAGLVTDLDEHLGERALTCLEAELEHRERRLRAAGVSDLPGWLRLPRDQRGEPLPRLVVVVDEFATLRAELPTFVESLVGIAQRGRSLGVHLLLGTQRPSGAVDENVRANANLRIALRMTDERDSHDVIGTGDAAGIPPAAAGRAFVRTGPRPPVAVQAALVTGRSAAATAAVRIGEVAFGPADDIATAGAPADEGPTDLERVVAACATAFDEGGYALPRAPWPAPLPDDVPLSSLRPAARDEDAAIGLVDEPDRQRQVPARWDPAAGNLLVHGAVGSGCTTTLATLVVAAAARTGPDDLHVHVVDLGRGELAPLATLPHCGAVVTAAERERRARLQAWLLAEADRRRRLSHDELLAAPFELVVVDGLDTWLDELDDPATYASFEATQRLVADAPRLRMAVVASTTRPGAIRSAIAGSVDQRLVHRLSDPNEYALVGLRPGDVPLLQPGRAVRTTDGRHLQVARVEDLGAAAQAVAARWPAPHRAPTEVRTLPDRVSPGDVGPVLVDGRRWWLPVGLDATTLEPAGWRLHPGEHAVVFGPPASGRTGLLGALAMAARGVADVVVVGAQPMPSDAVRPVDPAALGGLLSELATTTVPTLVLVDDAERVPDPGPGLADLQRSDAPVRLVVAARQDAVQGDYGHWLRGVARLGTGLLLRPTGDAPGDLLGVRVPRRAPVEVRSGRGWLAQDGAAHFVQVATTA